MSVEIVDNIFRKIDKPELVNVEYQKTIRAREIALKSGLFYVPEVLHFEASKGVLDFELISDLETLNDLVETGDSVVSTCIGQVGKAMQLVHSTLKLPETIEIDLNKRWKISQGSVVNFHGDLTLNNICYSKSKASMVLIDWSAAPLIGSRATRGSYHFDLLWLIAYFFYAIPIRCKKEVNPQKLANLLLEGYFDNKNSTRI